MMSTSTLQTHNHKTYTKVSTVKSTSEVAAVQMYIYAFSLS